MTASPSAESIADWVRRNRVASLTEAGLQRALGAMFTARGWKHSREVILGRDSRIDFMVGRVGVEVKINGTVDEVRRQLTRYAATGRVDDLVLISTRVRHRDLDGIVLEGADAATVLVRVAVPAWL